MQFHVITKGRLCFLLLTTFNIWILFDQIVPLLLLKTIH